MDARMAQALHERYAGAVALIEVADAQGNLDLGSAFHIGDGLFVTARHVVESPIQRVATTEPSTETFRSVLDVQRVEHLSEPAEAKAWSEPMFHPDPSVDIAMIDVEGIAAPAIPLVDARTSAGARLLLEPVLFLGYPWIPQSAERPLVAATCEVAAEIETLDRQRALVFSVTARRGLSGGPVVAETGALRAVMIRSLVEEEGDRPEPAHRGLLAGLRPEAVHRCLEHHGLRQRIQG